MIALARKILTCPEPSIIYKYIPENVIDKQFDSENFPSKIYTEMFVKSSPWIGGYHLGSGKSVVNDPSN